MVLSFGEKVRAMREKRRWKREELAEATEVEGGGGISVAQVRHVEEENTKPSEHIFNALSRAFGWNEIVTGEMKALAFPNYESKKPIIHRERINKYLMNAAVPVAIYTPLADLVAFNTYFQELYKLTPESLKILRSGELGSNILRLYFDLELRSVDLYGGEEGWITLTTRSIRIFRTISAKYINTPRYEQILKYFEEKEDFQKFWSIIDEAEPRDEVIHIEPIVTVIHSDKVLSFIKSDIPRPYLGLDIHIFSHVPTEDTKQAYNDFSSKVTENTVTEFNVPDIWYEEFEVITDTD